MPILPHEDIFLVYKGYLQNGLPNGKGIHVKPDGIIIEGHFVNGVADGPVKVKTNQGSLIYEGGFKND